MDTKLVTWDPEGVAAWAEVAPSEGAVMMHVLRGFIDGGKAGRLVGEHLLELGEPVRVATFDIDELLDYRSRRPEMTFSVNEWTEYDEPELVLDMVRDVEGTPFLLLHGFEPDIRWEAYIAEVRSMVERLGVGLVLGAHGIPMAAPHTRPLGVTVHGTSQDLLPDQPSMFGTVTVPASAQNLLEYRFGQWDLDMVNVAVHVPHYLAQSSYPQAAQRALSALEDLSGLVLEPQRLDEDAQRAEEEIARQMSESEEVQALVAALEEQFDAFTETRDDEMLREGLIPSADELGAEFEKYLRQHPPEFPQG
ncbi:PAC2 family protein [Demequina sp. NBRC 110054]|uniref:PAC2 family protein n=1 Tax=Demequina sp. NBRC 110054 TaxID=1570343 RepID=UPI0009FDB0F1|nr:PAC2 family protein [Demequina sp. NBRC 110054]